MNNINNLQEQFENLIKQGKELLEKMKEERFADTSKKVKRWKPKKGESYWYVSDHGRCVLTTSRCSELDEDYLILKNYGVRGRLYLNEKHYEACCILQDYWSQLKGSYRLPTVSQLKHLLILTEQKDSYREV